VSAYTYVPQDPANPSSGTVGVKLLDGMSRAGDRYFQPGERDFFAFFADPKIVPAPAPSPATPTSPTPTTRR
jgi:hypothetical protein